MKQVTINNVNFNVDPVVPSWPEFWDRVEAGLWEPETFALMDRFLEPGWRWVDIGAWIGPTALYAAAKGAQVDAYECDPVALRALKANLALNPELRVRVNEFALGAENKYQIGRSNQLGNSETSLIRPPEDHLWCAAVPVCDALEIFQAKGYASDPHTIVKMDVEGSEFVILPRLAELISDSRCVWLVSFHGFLLGLSSSAREAREREMFDLFAGLERSDLGGGQVMFRRG